jgi:hypothetical protein
MMNRRYIEENDIVMKYLRGELAIAQQTEFEQFYLDDPETLDQLEAAMALHAHLPGRTSSVAAVRWFSLPTIICSAASLLLGIALILPFKFGQEPLVQPNIRTIVIDTNRGAASMVSVDRRPGEKLIVLRLPLASSEADLTLALSRNGEEVLETSGLSSDYLGDVLVALPVGLLADGPTLLSLRRGDGTVVTEEQISVQ